jgi:hypothetical protein
MLLYFQNEIDWCRRLQQEVAYGILLFDPLRFRILGIKRVGTKF